MLRTLHHLSRTLNCPSKALTHHLITHNRAISRLYKKDVPFYIYQQIAQCSNSSESFSSKFSLRDDQGRVNASGINELRDHITHSVRTISPKMLCTIMGDIKDITRDITPLYPPMHAHIHAQAVDRLLHSLVLQLTHQRFDSIPADMVSHILRGFHHVGSETRPVRSLMKIVAPLMTSSCGSYTSVMIEDCLRALSHKNLMHKESVILLKAVTDRVDLCEEPLSAECLSVGFRICSQWTSYTSEVRLLERALNRHICLPHRPALSPEDIVLCLRELKNMPSSHKEMDEVVLSLGRHLQSCNTVQTETLCELINSLRGRSIGSPPTQEVLRTLSVHVNTASGSMSASQLVRVLCGMKEFSSEHSDVRNLIAALCNRSLVQSDLSSSDIFTDMANLMHMSTDHKEIQMLLAALTSVIARSSALPPSQIAQLVSGMRRMTSSNIEVVKLLNALSRTVSVQERLSPQYLLLVLQGLENMQLHHPSVQKFASAIFANLDTAQDIPLFEASKCFYLLKNYSHRATSFRKVVNYITSQVGKSKEPWIPVIVSNIFCGMQNMHPNDEEMKMILPIVRVGLAKCKGRFTEPDLGKTLKGLCEIYSNSPDFRKVLIHMTDAIDNCQEPFTSDTLATAVNSMKRMMTSDNEVMWFMWSLLKKVRLFKGTLSGDEIGLMLGGLRNMRSEVNHVKELLRILQRKVEMCTDPLTGSRISHGLFGLKFMDSRHKEVCALVIALSNKISPEGWKANEVAAAIYGMQSMDSNAVPIRALVSALIEPVRQCEGKFRAIDVARALHGLKQMNNSSLEVIKLTAALKPKVLSCDELLVPPYTSRSISGLQLMWSGDENVRDIFNFLADNLDRSSYIFSSEAVVNALYGLRNKSSDCPAVKKMLCSLASKVSGCHGQFNFLDISLSLYGLQGMTSDEESVCEIVQALSTKMKMHVPSLDSADVAKALYGMQRMDMRAPPVREVALKLCGLAMKCDTFSPLSAAMSLFGLVSLCSDKSWLVHRAAVESAIHHIIRCVGANVASGFKGDDITPLNTFVATMNLLQFYGKSYEFSLELLDDIDAIRMESFRNMSNSPLFPPTPVPSKLETRFAVILRHILAENQVCYNMDEGIYMEGFECDMLLRRTSENGKCKSVYNIEVDGPMHRFPSSVNFSRRRDEFFKDVLGISVIRVNIADLYSRASVDDAVCRQLCHEILEKLS